MRNSGLPIEMRISLTALSKARNPVSKNIYLWPSLPRARAEALPSMEYLDTNLGLGVPMPRYLTQHTLACLTRQGAEALAQRMQAGGLARAERVLVNMLEGKMFVEFRANSREDLEAWLKTEAMHFDFLVRIEWELQGDKLQIAE